MVLPKGKVYGDGTISALCYYVNQRKICRTSDGTIHIVSCYGPPTFPNPQSSYVRWSYLRDSTYLDSLQNDLSTLNLGSITLDAILYALPTDLTKPEGSYSALFNPSPGFVFDHWEITGGMTVLDPNTNPTTATLAGAWTNVTLYTYPPGSGDIDFPSITRDLNDDLYFVRVKRAIPSQVIFRKGTVNKTNPLFWTWTLGPEIVVVTDANGLDNPDILVDSNGYIYITYLGTISMCGLAKSINGGTTWTVTSLPNLPSPPVFYNGLLIPNVEKDSLNNLYIGVGDLSGGPFPRRNYIIKITTNPQTLVLKAAGYFACVPGDVGKPVRDDGVEIGTLVSYVNGTRTWVINTSSVVLINSVMAITGGTGAGSANAQSTGSTGTWQAVSSGNSRVCQLIVLPDDRLCMIYDLSGSNLIFRKTTNPRDIVTWNPEVTIASGTQNGYHYEYNLSYQNASNLFVIYCTNAAHVNLDLVMKKSTDGGLTWSAIEYLTNDNKGNRMPACIDNMGTDTYPIFVFRDGIYTINPHNFAGDLWFAPQNPLTPGGTLRAIYKIAATTDPEEIYRTHFLSFLSSGDVPIFYLAKDLIITQDGKLYLRLWNTYLVELS